MRVRVIVTVLAAVAATLLPVTLAGPAAAGGPTSVLLSAPALATTASLYTTDAEYAALAEHVGAGMALGSSQGASGSDTSEPAAHAIGNAVTVTWLIHDVTVWRVDRIYVDAPGGPWIASQEDVSGSGSIWEVPEAWHRATEPEALLRLLGSLGLVAATGADTDSGTIADQLAPEAVTDGPATSTDPATGSASTAAPTGTDAGGMTALVMAGLLGLALGVVSTVLVMAGLRRRSAAGATWDEAEPKAGGDVLSSDGTRGEERQPAGIAGGG